MANIFNGLDVFTVLFTALLFCGAVALFYAGVKWALSFQAAPVQVVTNDPR